MEIVRTAMLPTFFLIYAIIMGNEFASVSGSRKIIRDFNACEYPDQWRSKLKFGEPLRAVLKSHKLMIRSCTRNGKLYKLIVDKISSSECRNIKVLDEEIVLPANLTAVKYGWYKVKDNDVVKSIVSGIKFVGTPKLMILKKLVEPLPDNIKRITIRKPAFQIIEKGFLRHNSTLELVITDGAIDTIAAGAIEMPNLDVLAIIKHKISNVTFVATLPSSITLLDLGSNQISTLRPGVFKNLKNLQALLLTDNKLKKISRFSFRNLHKLTCLDLSYNPWKGKEGVLTGLKSLSALFLKGSNITEITGKFINLPILGLLDLTSSKSLYYVGVGALNTAQCLCYINFKGTKIKSEEQLFRARTVPGCDYEIAVTRRVPHKIIPIKDSF